MTTAVKRERKVAKRPQDGEVITYVFATDLDWAAIAWGENGVREFSIGRSSPQEAVAALKESSDISPTDAPRKGLPKGLAEAISKIERYAAGKEVDLTTIPYDTSDLTAFQRRVINACRKIPRGKVLSYQQLGAKAGSPRSARAVGNVMRNNCVPLIVPCHRVVAASGLGGYSCPTGLTMKRRLLKLEGLELP